MEIQEPKINIEFYLEGREKVELDEISKRLNIIPNTTKTPADWPEAIKNPQIELPDELKPRYVWELDIGYKYCKSVSDRFDIIFEILKGKEIIINELKEKFSLNASFVVSIYAQHDQCNMPEIFLTEDIILFMAVIGAEIGFDMYLD